MKSVLYWIFLALIAFRYITKGLLLIPFGKAGEELRRMSGFFGDAELRIGLGAKYTVHGLENLDPNRSYIFVGNHQSYADIFLMLGALHSVGMRTLFMAKRQLFNIPVFGAVGRHMGLIPVEREESKQAIKSLIGAVQTLHSGHSVVVFAEGSRTKDGNLQPFKKGASLLASQTGLPLAPFVITGTMDMMPAKNLSIHRGKECSITFLPPIEPAGLSAKTLNDLIEGQVSAKYNELRKV